MPVRPDGFLFPFPPSFADRPILAGENSTRSPQQDGSWSSSRSMVDWHYHLHAVRVVSTPTFDEDSQSGAGRLCGYTPFRSEDRAEMIKETTKAKVEFHERYWKNVSQEGALQRGATIEARGSDLCSIFSQGLYLVAHQG